MIGPRTKAILAPNLVGNCPDWDRIRAIADRHGLLVVEDSCDVLDSWLRGTPHRHARRHRRHQLRPRARRSPRPATAAWSRSTTTSWFDQRLMRRRWGRRSETLPLREPAGRPTTASAPLADGTPYDIVFMFDDIGYNFEPSEIEGRVRARAARQARRVQRAAAAELRRARRRARAPRGQVVPRRAPRPTSTPRGCASRSCSRDGHRPHRGAGVPARARGIPTRMVWTGNILRQPGFAGIAHRAPDRRAARTPTG